MSEPLRRALADYGKARLLERRGRLRRLQELDAPEIILDGGARLVRAAEEEVGEAADQLRALQPEYDALAAAEQDAQNALEARCESCCHWRGIEYQHDTRRWCSLREATPLILEGCDDYADFPALVERASDTGRLVGTLAARVEDLERQMLAVLRAYRKLAEAQVELRQPLHGRNKGGASA